MINRLRTALRNLKMRLALKWVEQAGYYVVRMQQRGGWNAS